ncbi:hypothetical protein N790_10050 [Arenimonas malthae CC-JY-1]|uniref:Transmembrane protein n=2 Tax=Arenimonas TaxID=490567 RepID=A0A091AYK1_9GAMM|nr:hypothetical protein N790_10050 [Arenimonas malthae CC-JY-1]
MALHMLVQIPLLVLAGHWLSAVLPARFRQTLQSFNAHGVSGWVLASLALAFWMLPRALDAAVATPWIDAAKFSVLLLAGAALRGSWAASRPVIQLFFIGNWAWMTATVGLLYVEAPQRLCNAYLLGDQATTGYGLIAAAVLLPLLWGWDYLRRNEA